MRKTGLGMAAWVGMGMAAWAEVVVIESFDSSGKVTFGEVANAAGYRVEWASVAGGAWTNSWDALNGIPSTGLGTVTVAVPMLYRVVATVTSAPPPSGMVLIPAGSFVMGNATNVFPAGEGDSDELPQHTVYVSGFYMGQYEVTKGAWDDVYNWAITNGYGFDNVGSGKAANHPVQTIGWYDVVKWCNARSQKEGLTPCYTVGGSVYTNRQSEPECNWAAAGYRLPTDAEWEKAARGGAANTRFPWADTNIIDHSLAIIMDIHPAMPMTWDMQALTRTTWRADRLTRVRSAHLRRTDTGCTTWRGTCGSGAGTGMMGATTRHLPARTRVVLCQRAPSGCSAAAVGTTTRTLSGAPVGVATGLTAGTSAWGFGWLAL